MPSGTSPTKLARSASASNSFSRPLASLQGLHAPKLANTASKTNSMTGWLDSAPKEKAVKRKVKPEDEQDDEVAPGAKKRAGAVFKSGQQNKVAGKTAATSSSKNQVGQAGGTSIKSTFTMDHEFKEDKVASKVWPRGDALACRVSSLIERPRPPAEQGNVP